MRRLLCAISSHTRVVGLVEAEVLKELLQLVVEEELW